MRTIVHDACTQAASSATGLSTRLARISAASMVTRSSAERPLAHLEQPDGLAQAGAVERVADRAGIGEMRLAAMRASM